MQEVDINTLVNNYYLIENIPNNIIIIGKIDKLIIKYKYDKLNLSKVECNKVIYFNQEGESIKNHKLPNSLKEFDCHNNQITSLPEHLPNSIQRIWCNNNQLTSLLKLPNSLKEIDCNDNQLTSLPDLPNLLTYIGCRNNQLTSLPDLSHIYHKITIILFQDIQISYIPYNTNLRICTFIHKKAKINIEGYQHNPITNQEELDKYMDYRLYKMNRIKSGKK